MADQSEEEKQAAEQKLKDKKETASQESYLLNLDLRKAVKYEEKNGGRQHKITRMRPDELKIGLNKMRKRIRDVYDDEDEDENDLMFSPIHQQTIPVEEEALSLINALTPDERRQLQAMESQKAVKMQENAGKMEALLTADKLAYEVTSRGISQTQINDGMQDALFLPQVRQDKVIRKEVAQKLGLHGHIEDGKIIQAARGIKKARQIGGEKATQELEMSDMVQAGEGKMSERDLAKLILKKSGQETNRANVKHPTKQAEQTPKLKYLKQAQDKNKREADRSL